MNRIYRLVWCRSIGAMVATSELARASRRSSCSGSRVVGRPSLLLSAIMLGFAAFLHGSVALAQDAKLADLQSVMDRYDSSHAAVPVATAAASRPYSSAARVAPPMPVAVRPGHRQPAVSAGQSAGLRHTGEVAMSARGSRAVHGSRPRNELATATATATRGQAPTAAMAQPGRASSLQAAASPQAIAPHRELVSLKATDTAREPVADTALDRRRVHATRKIDKDDNGEDVDDDVLAATEEDKATASDSATPTTPSLSPYSSPVVANATLSQVQSAPMPTAESMAIVQPQAVPVVPPPGPAPTGLIVGNGGVVGTTTDLLGSTPNALFNNTDGYVTSGSLRVDNANFTQGYSTLNLLGLPVLNLTPVGTVLTATNGDLVGGTGINSHLTLLGGVSSGNYINNINNGAAGGLLGLVLPGGAPAWSSTCLNVLGVLTESCWGVNAAQDYQVLVGDGATANGSKEVVIGTNASHTLATVDADTVFPGDGRDDPNNPSGVPTADYGARLGHSVVIGDDAAGTANAQTIIGAEATASVANSVALGYQSSATRGAQAGYTAYGLAAPQTSVGEVSIGSPGSERQITNLAAGSADTDAVNVAQLKSVSALAGNSVQYDDVGETSVTLGGTTSTDGGVTNGTTISNVHQGDVSATSTDAVNGAQLYATNTSINNIYDVGTKYFQANSALAAAAATGADSVAAGPAAIAGGDSSVAVGNGATASANDALAFGAGATASMANSIALGADSVTLVGAQTNYTAYGLTAPQTSAGELNVGNRQITGVAAGSAQDDAVNVAQLEGVAGVANNSVQYDDASKAHVTLGGTTSTDGGVTDGTVLGNLHQADLSATSTEAVNGSQLYATNNSITNINDNGTRYFHAESSGTDSMAVGQDSVAIGMNAVATNSDDVALGANSITSAPHTGDFAFYGGSAAGNAFAALSVGAPGQERQIQNVAPGVLAATSTDAVNGSQLFSVVSGVNTLGTSLASSLGGVSTYDSGTGMLTAGLNYGGGSYDSVQAVLDALTGGGSSQGIKYFHVNSAAADGGASGSDSVAVGPQADASGASSVAMGDGASASADDALALGTGANASMANSIALGAGSITSVGALTSYTAYGLVSPQTSLGELNVGDRQITGVAAGSADDDAVNVAQLKAVGDQVDSVDKLAVKYDADSSGNATNTITLLGDGSGAQVKVSNMAAGDETTTSTDAVNGSQLWHWTQDTSNIYSNYNLYNDIASLTQGSGTIKYFNVNSTLGDSTATGSDSVAIGPVAEASGSDSVAIGNGAAASGDNSVAIGAGSVADRDNTVSVGSDGNSRQITNVAAGTEGTDAVNLDQLNASMTASTQGSVHYDTNGSGGIDYGNVTLGNGGGPTTIHNVAAGVADTDAVNVGQLNTGLARAVNWANSYTDQQVRELGNRANAGVAAAMAMAGMPQAYEPGKSMAAVSAGTFRGESSLAIGVSTISEGGRWVYKLTGSTDTRGDAGVSIGAGFQW
ncbi:YadA-like family protein [Rhodanobacter sp. Root179]|uniref:YadA-like family protein n=1 Tax=Rhodanobacter sp. Root179 TaxID=1736482 RepID=UPI00138F6939|nr:YadA-like family protein [Rhodanobacter sp. Root179]